MKKIATLLAVFATLVMPCMALAQGSGGDAYTEDIPGPGGNPPSNEGGNGGSVPGDTQSLPGETQSDFAAEGDDGAAAANLAQSTGPDGNGSNGDGTGAGQTDDAATASGSSDSSDSDSDSGFGEAVVELVGGSDDGMGPLLPIILGSALIAAVAFVIFRRSGGSTGSA